MRIRRGLLFWGLFLIPLGGIPLLARAGTIDPAVFADVWRLWPLVLVAIGLTLLLGRYRAGLIGVVAVALLLGSLAGGALASGRPIDRWLWRLLSIGSRYECGRRVRHLQR